MASKSQRSASCRTADTNYIKHDEKKAAPGLIPGHPLPDTPHFTGRDRSRLIAPAAPDVRHYRGRRMVIQNVRMRRHQPVVRPPPNRDLPLHPVQDHVNQRLDSPHNALRARKRGVQVVVPLTVTLVARGTVRVVQDAPLQHAPLVQLIQPLDRGLYVRTRKTVLHDRKLILPETPPIPPEHHPPDTAFVRLRYI